MPSEPADANKTSTRSTVTEAQTFFGFAVLVAGIFLVGAVIGYLRGVAKDDTTADALDRAYREGVLYVVGAVCVGLVVSILHKLGMFSREQIWRRPIAYGISIGTFWAVFAGGKILAGLDVGPLWPTVINSFLFGFVPGIVVGLLLTLTSRSKADSQTAAVPTDDAA